MATREKKPVHKVVMTEGKRNIIQHYFGIFWQIAFIPFSSK